MDTDTKNSVHTDVKPEDTVAEELKRLRVKSRELSATVFHLREHNSQLMRDQKSSNLAVDQRDKAIKERDQAVIVKSREIENGKEAASKLQEFQERMKKLYEHTEQEVEEEMFKTIQMESERDEAIKERDSARQEKDMAIKGKEVAMKETAHARAVIAKAIGVLGEVKQADEP